MGCIDKLRKLVQINYTCIGLDTFYIYIDTDD